MLGPEHLLSLRGRIEAALAECGGTHSWEDIERGVAEKKFQFWPGRDSFILTEIVAFPRKRVCHVFLAAGNLEEIHAIRTWVEKWARGIGCAGATINGRPGWEKVLAGDGWQKSSVCLEKSFEEVG